MKIKKNLLLTLILVLSLILNITTVNALDGVSCDELSSQSLNYIVAQTDPKDLDLSCKNGTPYTDEYLVRTEKSLNQLNNSGPQLHYFTHALSVTPFAQEKNNYCGPATLKEVIHFMNGTSKTQSDYAKELGTDSNGTYVYKFRDVINKYVNQKYNYVLGSTRTKEQFKTMLENSVDTKKPLVMHTMTRTLYLYNGHQTGHYIVATGNTVSSTAPYQVFYVDSNKSDYGRGSVFGVHLDSLDNVFNSVKLYGDRYLIY